MASSAARESSTRRIVRLMRLLELLHRHGEVATRDLVSLLETDRKKVMRDVHTLRDAGVPIYWVGRGRNRRHRLAPYFRRTGGTQDEALALALGRRLMDGAPTAPQAPAWLVVGHGAQARFTTDAVNSVLAAVSVGHRCRVDCAEGTLDVQPLGLVSVGGHLLLLARTSDGTEATLSLDHIDVDLLPDNDDAAGVVASPEELAAGVESSLCAPGPPGATYRIELSFCESVRRVAQRLMWPGDAEWSTTGGTVRVRAEMGALDALDRILSVGAGVTVHEPAWLTTATHLCERGCTPIK